MLPARPTGSDGSVLPLAAFGALLVLLNGTALIVADRWDADYPFVAAVLAQGAVYLAAARLVWRRPPGRAVLAIVVTVAALLRLMLIAGPPLHSSDAYRYVWDGRVQAAGINPYRFVPADPALAPLREAQVFPNINRADSAVTIYPPAAQLAFLLFTRIGDRLLGIRLGFLALEALAMLALARLLTGLGRPPAHLLLYAWHPLPVWEIAREAHVDAGMAAFLVFAVLAWGRGRRLAAGAFLAVSALFKPLTLAALPAFWRPWQGRQVLAFAITAVLLYVPYLRVGGGALGFLPAYVGEEGIATGSGFYLLELVRRTFGTLPVAALHAYLAAGGALLAGLAIASVRDPDGGVLAVARRAQVLLLASLVVMSPNYPWYFLVLVPLGCLVPWAPSAVATLLCVVLYAAPPLDGLRETFLAQGLLYGGIVCALLWPVLDRVRAPHIHGGGGEEQTRR